MNPDTGEFRHFGKDEEIPEGWVEWAVGELIEVKKGLFRVVGIDAEKNIVKLQGINKKARKGLTSQKLKDDYGIRPQEANMI